jgi:hypothetical protein
LGHCALRGDGIATNAAIGPRPRITHKIKTVYLMRFWCMRVPHYVRAQNVTAELPEVYDSCCGDLYPHTPL